MLTDIHARASYVIKLIARIDLSCTIEAAVPATRHRPPRPRHQRNSCQYNWRCAVRQWIRSARGHGSLRKTLNSSRRVIAYGGTAYFDAKSGTVCMCDCIWTHACASKPCTLLAVSYDLQMLSLTMVKLDMASHFFAWSQTGAKQRLSVPPCPPRGTRSPLPSVLIATLAQFRIACSTVDLD